MTITEQIQMDDVVKKKELITTQKEKIHVIGECGCNWTTFDEALIMIEKALDAGCFAVKFQLFTKEMAKESKIDPILALSFEDAEVLFNYGKRIGIDVFFTPMYEKSVDWCEKLNVRYYKVRHKDNHNLPLYRKIKKTKKFTFISVNNENDLWNNYVNYRKGVFLYCVPKYPAQLNDYKQAFEKGYIGISDHTNDLELLKKAIDHNIMYFEKHVCLNEDCLESKWSVTFDDLKEVMKNE